MDVSQIFGNSRLVEKTPCVPHLNDRVVCYSGGCNDILYPFNTPFINEDILLVLITEGETLMALNGTEQTAGKGTLIIYGANYHTRIISVSKDVHYHILSISRVLLEEDTYLSQTVDIVLSALRSKGTNSTLFEKGALKTLTEHLDTVERLLDSDHSYLSRRVLAECVSLYLDVADNISKQAGIIKHLNSKEKLLQDFHAVVTLRFREQHHIEYYASKLNISSQYLSRIVRAGTGKSVGFIISELIIVEAKSLLGSRALTVNEIALRLGFTESSSFCKFFKRQTGVSPLAYRRQSLDSQ